MSSGMRTHIHKDNYGHKFPLELRTSTCLNEIKREDEIGKLLVSERAAILTAL